jgi:hypothetical protein
MSLGLRGDFLLSANNLRFATSFGIAFGVIVILITTPFLLKQKKAAMVSGFIIGIIKQMFIFSGFYIYIAIGASV